MMLLISKKMDNNGEKTDGASVLLTILIAQLQNLVFSFKSLF